MQWNVAARLELRQHVGLYFYQPLTGQYMEGNIAYALWALAALLVLVGLAGTFLPALPGVPLVFGGLFLAAYIGDFERIGWPTLTILGVFTAVAIAADFVATLLGAKRAGASKLALVGAAIGSLLGIFSGLWGLLVFPLIGAVAGELIARQQIGQASRVGLATWLGMVIGTLAKLAIALTMVGVFIVSYVFGK
ncbi:MAG: DUF456 domain-containing protein [Burkholderiales bacterium]